MPTFQCRARDPEGRLVTERLEAGSRLEAAEALEKRGLLPVAIEIEGSAAKPGAAPSSAGPRRGGKAPARELALVTRQLATLVRAGVVIHTALDIVAVQCQNPNLKQALQDVAQEVMRGSSLSRAMSRHPNLFDTAFINGIEAGQLSGKLDAVLTRLAGFMEVGLKRRASVKSALRYPAIVMATFIAAFFFLVRFVVPSFKSLFSRFGTELPLPTRILLGCHAAITDYGWITGLSVAALVAGVIFFVNTPYGRRFWDRWKLALPLMGPLQTKSAVSTFVQTFNTLNEAGVPILQNLDTSAQAIGNKELEARMVLAREGVERGEPLSKQLQEKVPQFPPLVAQMFLVGEKSGRMAEILDPLVAHYDMETQQAIEGLTAAIEPMITILLGVMVLFLALGIFLPSWQLMHVVQGKPK